MSPAGDAEAWNNVLACHCLICKMGLIILEMPTNTAHIISGTKFLVTAPSCLITKATGRMVNGIIHKCPKLHRRGDHF